MMPHTHGQVRLQAWNPSLLSGLGGLVPDVAEKDTRAKELGSWLTQWRRKRGLSRPETVAQALKHDPRASLSADYLAKLEYGVRNLASAATDNREALRLALNISRETWEVETGLLVPARHAGDHAAEPPARVLQTPSAVEITGYRMMPIYALASAGVDAAEAVPLYDYPPLMFPESSWHPALRMFLACGHSMDSGRENSIRDGDIIHVDMRDLDPTVGRICVVMIPDQGIFVKRVQQFGAGLWLVSDNPDQAKYPPFQVEEATVLGSVIDLTRRVRLNLS
jgi:SOS-response transcriptional repressor LexA